MHQFNECDSFKGNGLENFDTSNAKDIQQMFEQCPNFIGDMIGGWNTSLVTNMKSLVCSMKKMALNRCAPADHSHIRLCFHAPTSLIEVDSTVTYQSGILQASRT